MKKLTPINNALLLAAAVVFFASCDEQADVQPLQADLSEAAYDGIAGVEEDITNGGGTIMLDASVSDLYHVYDFYQGDTSAEPEDPHDIASTYYFSLEDNEGGSSTSFDLEFTGTANGNIYPGSGSTLAYVDKAFSAVTASDYNSANEKTYFGYNTTGSVGWYNYNISTHIVTAVADRTMILKNGSDYYKIAIISLYEGAAPDTTYAASDYPYFTFDYQKL